MADIEIQASIERKEYSRLKTKVSKLDFNELEDAADKQRYTADKASMEAVEASLSTLETNLLDVEWQLTILTGFDETDPKRRNERLGLK